MPIPELSTHSAELAPPRLKPDMQSAEPNLSGTIDFLSQMSDNPVEFLQGANSAYKVIESLDTHPVVSSETLRQIITALQEKTNRRTTPFQKPRDAVEILFGRNLVSVDGRIKSKQIKPEQYITQVLTTLPPITREMRKMFGNFEQAEKLGAETVLRLKIYEKETQEQRSVEEELTANIPIYLY